MSNDRNIYSCLQRLPGVYRDPPRIRRDAASLLSSSVGRHLLPEASSFVENDGTTVKSLLLKGTVPMTYRGATYNIPVDVYLPPQYPIRPPVVYVRPVSSMMIKEGHRHVAADGMVYMPYLHSWNAGSHNLVDACLAMSQMFGNDPPVYAKPPGYDAAKVQPTPTPPPPRYEQVAVPAPAPVPQQVPSNNTNNTTTTGSSSSGNGSGITGFPSVFSSLLGGKWNASSQNGDAALSAEERIAKEAQEANEVAAIARAAEEKEKQEQKLKQESRDKLTQMSTEIMDAYRKSTVEDLRSGIKDQMLVEKSRTFVQDPKEGQIAYLTKRKQELEKHHQELDGFISKLSQFVKSVEKEKSSRVDISVDELAIPGDIHSAQMLVLSAENAAINDALYFLDKALAEHRISLEEHLRAVRKLSKQQFLAKAHLLKIGQVKASEALQPRSAWS